MSSPRSHTQTPPVNQDDEGDICPICESECTCDNNRLSIAPQKHGLLPSLKVKVAASSSSNPKPSGSNKQIRPRPSVSTSANAHLPQTGQFSVSDPRLKSHLLDPTIPKRRGRPPKVVVAARAALVAAASAANSSPERVAGPSTLPQRPKAKFLKNIAKPCPKSKFRGSNTIKASLSQRKRKVDGSYHPKGFVRRRPLVEDHDDSDGEDEENNFLLEDDDDVEPSAPLDLPTFISASSSSSESSSLSSLSSSEDSGLEDMEMELEEEQNIKESEDEKERKARKDKARVRRELLGENDPRQNGRSHHTNNRWDIKPRKRSVSASDGEADVDMDAESGDTTESEDEDQDAVVADDEDELDAIEMDRDGRRKLGVSFAGVVTGWSDGEDSNYDADLFFANLDSSESDSGSNAATEMSSMDADGEDGDQDSGDEIAEAMTLAAAAGLYDGWEGPIVFAARDVDVEMDLSPSLKPSRRRRMSSSILTTDDEQVGQKPTNPTACGSENHLEEDDEICLAESDGETTEEELIGADGLPNARAMMLFKWPISVGAVDPMNTLTPGRRRNGSAPRRSTPQHEPEDLDDGSDKSLDGIKTPNYKKAGVLRTPRGPVAGTFQLTPQGMEPTNTAVITGHQPALPSPYPRSRRLFSSVERIGHRSIRDRSLSVSGQSSVQTEASSVPGQSTDLDIFTTESMDLDDVLEAAFLVSDSSTSDGELSSHAERVDDRTDVGEMSSRSHVEDLRRWERIPMTAFRRTRESQGSISNDDGTPWSAKSGDGTDFYTVAMMNSNLQHLLSSPTPAPSQKQPIGRAGLATLSSPISHGGSGSGGRGVRNSRMLTRDHRSEKERKEDKKTLRKMAHTKPSLGRPFISNHQAHLHHRHQHHPNTKSRASGSMQRTNFFNSPPTLGNP
ncbi:hypothetical protein BDM02DRAFT_3186751 [Thelephora ganbajun]|uniref:Uncharacterized protein n=1 Tax=Thelephora ganbajun TaxID=370292 RepID=A0ACB6ZHI6_THEGA|nr:hypothetical protein BDM02DRAFT_3186751 [Thelephora ganbajun]